MLFARQGLRVALIERHADLDAYKVMCTHFIQAEATPTIQRLGIAEALEAAGAVRNGLQIWTRWGWIHTSIAERPDQATYGYNIRRQTLDPILRHAAIETPGVEFMPGQTARHLLAEGGRFTGAEIVGRDGHPHTIAARLVVGADGRNSRVAELAQAPARVLPHKRFGYAVHYRNLPLASGDDAQLWFCETDVAYAFPNDDGVTVLACFMTKDKLPAFKRDLNGSFTRLFESLPGAPRIAEAEQISKIMGALDMPNISRRAALPGLALIGDAALAADPLWGTGCGWAFRSAEWLVEHTAAALREGGDVDRALERYRKEHRRRLFAHYLLNASYSTGRPFNPIQQLLFSAGTKDARTAQLLGEFGAGLIGVSQLLSPAAIGRALWANLTTDGGAGTPEGQPSVSG
jgi:2-polyprenyl-6-methoxyphenol hydroxylase-like FAD-dependent oxidoreductase